MHYIVSAPLVVGVVGQSISTGRTPVVIVPHTSIHRGINQFIGTKNFVADVFMSSFSRSVYFFVPNLRWAKTTRSVVASNQLSHYVWHCVVQCEFCIALLACRFRQPREETQSTRTNRSMFRPLVTAAYISFPQIWYTSDKYFSVVYLSTTVNGIGSQHMNDNTFRVFMKIRAGVNMYR